jgi:hypothetical protein
MSLRRLTLLLGLAACSAPRQPAAPATSGDSSACQVESHYVAEPAGAGARPDLPRPALIREPLRAGDAFTVWGASFYLRNPFHRAEVVGKQLAISGYIVKTNLPDAPACSVHAAGKADPPDCRAEVPTFWLGDRRDAPLTDCIRVLGFASNYAQLHDALLQYASGKPSGDYTDALWGQVIPNPIPAVGARVTVHGSYDTKFTMASSGAVRDEVMGLLTYVSLELLEPAPVAATLRGMKLPR